MAQDDDLKLNPDAVNAPFPTKDQLLALIHRRKEVLDLMDGQKDQSWVDNPYNAMRTELRAVTSAENKVDKQLKAASAVLQRDFTISHD
ncbi:MAG: hypothetical protein ACSHXB_20790 [Sulfitobacter sp.]